MSNYTSENLIPVSPGNVAPNTLVIKVGGQYFLAGGGGTDVSDTTAQAANVQSGYYFYNSAGVKTEGTLTVSGGVDVSDTTATAGMVLSGAVFHDSTGAQTSGTIPTVSASVQGGSVVVPSGYIASSQSFPVSSGGGTDVSSTTAEAADVLSGKVFYTSGGIKTSGTIPTIGSSSYTPTTSNQIISSGVYLGGDQTIAGDANLVGSNILSGVSIFGVSGTVVTGEEVTLGYLNSSGAFQAVSFSGTDAADSGQPVNLSCYVWNMPADPQIVNLYSGETLVSSAVSMTGVNVSSGYRMEVKGGTVKSCYVYTGGTMEVTFGGKIESVTCWYRSGSAPCSLSLSSGTATDTEIFGADMTVFSGGTAINTRVWEAANYGGNGYMTVSSGGTIINTTLGHGGFLELDGIAVSVNVLNPTYAMNIRSGATVTSLTCEAGETHLLTGGRAYDVQIQGGGMTVHSNGAIASNVIVSSGASLTVNSGGTALNVTSNTGANITVLDGGVITYA